jgi:hypothetical protein
MFPSPLTAQLSIVMVSTAWPDESTTLLDRAIRAQGGNAKLSQAQGATFHIKGTIGPEGNTFTLSGDIAAQAVDQVRCLLTFSFNPGLMATLTITPRTVWEKGKIEAREIGNPEQAIIRDIFRTIRLSQNLTLLRGKDVTLSHLGESRIYNRGAVGLKVATRGRPDVDLFFDKETALPLRAEVRVTERGEANEVVYAFFFADYKEVDGVKCASKITVKRDNHPVAEMEFSDFKFQEKLDETLFAKP